MPDSTGTPADGTTGTPDASATGTPAAEPKAGDTNPQTGKTFTQAELDAIIADRVARAKPADYDEAKAALAEKRAREEGEKTEIQKLTEQRDAEKARADGSDQRANTALRTAEIRIEALKQGADEELVAMALAADDTITVEKDGTVKGAKEAVEKLLDRKPNLKLGEGTRQSGAEFGGADRSTVSEQIAALEAKGDKESLRAARDLKIEQGLALAG